ncbi:MAG: TonB-dependent receptor [Pseudomonadota bacterium]
MAYSFSRTPFFLTPIAAGALAALLAPAAIAQTAPELRALPQVNVIGGVEKLPGIAGAGQVLEERDLEASHVYTVNEALRKVPGVVVRDEDGFGLRPNIAIRGLNPSRSTKITLLEDGIPLAYAPYGDNATYYHPPIDRFRSIEVLKGAGSLLFGPQTIGGVVNYITPAPPREFGGFVQSTVGNRGFFNGRVSVGGNGLQVDYTRKEGQGSRENQSHAIDDLSVKYVTSLSNNQAITLRANYYKENSQISYTGITQAEFDRLGARYNPFTDDTFDTQRIGVSATHEIFFDKGAQLLTNVYYAKFDRDWWRQQSNTTDTSQCNPAFRAARLAGNRVTPAQCNSTQGRLRSYYNAGIEPRLTVPYAGGEFQAGLKLHKEGQDRLQLNGTSSTARTGTVAENALRETNAISGYISNRFDIGSVSITPILRYESVEANRVNRLNTAESGSTKVAETLPGIGMTWNLQKNMTLFGSLHKGFAPPRVEDLIGNTGTVTEVGSEKSTNLELGVRSQPTDGVSLQAAYFRTRFDNLIASGSIAGGSTPLSQGKALFQGLELAADVRAKSGLFSRLAYTWVPTAEQTTAFRNVANNALVGVQGNRQPYAPKQTLTAAAGYSLGAWHAELEVQHVGKQFSDFANTQNPSADGQRGQISAYSAFNAALNYRIDKALSVFLVTKNLTDKTYIVDRTRGILVGQPRLVQVGLRYGF